MNRRSKVELTTSAEDWEIIRECYVKSFLRYPLYKYMVPDQTKREEFLRAYLDANYEVTVGSGQAILLGMWITENEVELALNQRQDNYKLVGGLILLFPSTTGKGWAIQNDEPYWQAYEKYKLADISEEGMRRVKRYEAWEHSIITKRLFDLGVPMWNGLFFALLPEYTSQGLVSQKVERGVQLFSRAWQTQMKLVKSQVPTLGNKSDSLVDPPSRRGRSQLNVKEQYSQSTVSDCSSIDSKEACPSDPSEVANEILPNFSSAKRPSSATSPLVVGICHGERSANFYIMNGFKKFFQTDFADDGILFTVTVFALDISHRKIDVSTSKL